jgi:hypothetical protein
MAGVRITFPDKRSAASMMALNSINFVMLAQLGRLRCCVSTPNYILLLPFSIAIPHCATHKKSPFGGLWPTAQCTPPNGLLSGNDLAVLMVSTHRYYFCSALLTVSSAFHTRYFTSTSFGT